MGGAGLWQSLYPRVADADALLAGLGLESKRKAWFMELVLIAIAYLLVATFQTWLRAKHPPYAGLRALRTLTALA